MLFLTNQILTDSLSIAYHLIIIVFLKFITLYFQENNGQKRIIKMYCNTGLSKEKREKASWDPGWDSHMRIF